MRTSPERTSGAFALPTTLILLSVALATLAGVLLYCQRSSVWVQRTAARGQALAAAEAATEQVVAEMQQHFRTGGLAAVTANLSLYPQLVPSVINAGAWSDFEFLDRAGVANRVTLALGTPSISLTNRSMPPGAPTYVVESFARTRGDVTGTNLVTVGVRQKLSLLEVPLSDFAAYYTIDLEFHPWHDWTVYGRMHSNNKCYFKPTSGATLTFREEVSAVGGIVHDDHPDDPEWRSLGSIVYLKASKSGVASFSMPGISPSETSLRFMVETPPGGESVNSQLGRQRFHNHADLIIRVYDDRVEVRTSVAHGQNLVSAGALTSFVSTNAPNLYDAREGKTVRLTVIDVATLRSQWAGLNAIVPNPNGVQALFVEDQRALPNGSTLNAVKVMNGSQLPDSGLCVTTPNPLYLRGNFNTVSTRRAIVAGDAITLLSNNWNDTAPNWGSGSVSGRPASDTTYKFTAIAGIVPTRPSESSGGVLNALRLVEDWQGRTASFDGSLCVLYPSQIAVGTWQNIVGTVYRAPTRNYRFGWPVATNTTALPYTPKVYGVLRSGYEVLGPPPT